MLCVLDVQFLWDVADCVLLRLFSGRYIGFLSFLVIDEPECFSRVVGDGDPCMCLLDDALILGEDDCRRSEKVALFG